MSKSRARLLAELLNSTGLVKKSKSALAGADSVIDLDTLPTITNAKLENSSISIAGHSTALGGTVTLNTGDIGEHENYKYYTDARVDTRIVSAGSSNWNTAYGWATTQVQGIWGQTTILRLAPFLRAILQQPERSLLMASMELAPRACCR